METNKKRIVSSAYKCRGYRDRGTKSSMTNVKGSVRNVTISIREEDDDDALDGGGKNVCEGQEKEGKASETERAK